MALASRLLIAGGGAGFTLLPSQVTLTAAPKAGWTQINEAKAVEYGGVLYIGYVNGTSGDLELITYSGGVTSSPITIHSGFAADTHNAPALLVMDTGKLIVAYSKHLDTPMRVRISVNTLGSDPTLSGGFGSAITAHSGGQHTYPTLLQRNAETNVPIYLIYRSASTSWVYIKSSDHGATWTSPVTIFTNGAATYMKVATDSQWRIDFVVTDDNPSNATSRIFHFYADDVDYKKSDGTQIGAFGPPFDTSHLTQVYDSSAGPGWPTHAIWDGTNPRFVYSVDNGSGTDSSFRYARWTGTAWSLSTIVSSVGAGIVDPSPVASLDSLDLTRVHYCAKQSGKFEMIRARTTDNGTTWTPTNLTSGSSVDNIYPTQVHGWTSGKVGVLWTAGTYTSDQSNSMAILGQR